MDEVDESRVLVPAGGRSSSRPCWKLIALASSARRVPGLGGGGVAIKPGFTSRLMLKDLSLALSTATHSNLDLQIGKKVLKNYKSLVDNKKGDLDFSNIVNHDNS